VGTICVVPLKAGGSVSIYPPSRRCLSSCKYTKESDGVPQNQEIAFRVTRTLRESFCRGNDMRCVSEDRAVFALM